MQETDAAFRYSSGGGDLFVKSFNDGIRVFRVDSFGQISHVANITAAEQTPVFTNGKLIASTTSSKVDIWKYSGGVVSQMGSITMSSSYDMGAILSDDSILLVVNSLTVNTYIYKDNAWTQVNIFNANTSLYTTGLTPTVQITDQFIFVSGGVSQGSVDRNRFFRIYTRNADYSWTLTDSANLQFPTIYQVPTLMYNGADTVFATSKDADVEGNGIVGIIYIVTKTNNKWVSARNISAVSLGYTGETRLGEIARIVNQRTAVFSATTANNDLGKPNGAVFLLNQNADGSWGTEVSFITSDWNVYFGRNIDTTAKYVVISSLALYPVDQLLLQTLPSCPLSPIATSCPDVPFNSSGVTCQFGDADKYQFVTNPECGAFRVTQSSVSTNGNNLTLTYTFERDFVDPKTCTFNMVCSLPKKNGGSALSLSLLAMVSIVVSVLYAIVI